MKTTRTSRYLTIAAAAALSLTLASCTGSDESGDESTSADETTAAEQTDDDEQSGDAETTEAETTEDEDEGDDSASGGAECLLGSWEMTADAMQEQVLAQLGGEGDVSVEGTSGMQIEADQLTRTDDFSSTSSIDMDGTAIDGNTTSDGSYTVAYTADGSTITYGEVASAEGAVTVDISGSQQEISFADSAAALAGMSMTYTCSDSELTLTSDVAGAEFSQTFARS